MLQITAEVLPLQVLLTAVALAGIHIPVAGTDVAAPTRLILSKVHTTVSGLHLVECADDCSSQPHSSASRQLHRTMSVPSSPAFSHGPLRSRSVALQLLAPILRTPLEKRHAALRERCGARRRALLVAAHEVRCPWKQRQRRIVAMRACALRSLNGCGQSEDTLRLAEESVPHGAACLPALRIYIVSDLSRGQQAQQKHGLQPGRPSLVRRRTAIALAASATPTRCR